MEWWQSQSEMPTRDYFRVEDESGLRFWLYRDGLYGEGVGERQPGWFLHGLFA
jgi:protein ImuB